MQTLVCELEWELEMGQNSKTTLPFQKPGKPWCVKATGDYAADCATGRRYALLAIAHGDPTVIAYALAAMPSMSTDTGIEIGFRTTLAEAAIGSGAVNILRQNVVYLDEHVTPQRKEPDSDPPVHGFGQ
jgi:hypothetical protein